MHSLNIIFRAVPAVEAYFRIVINYWSITTAYLADHLQPNNTRWPDLVLGVIVHRRAKRKTVSRRQRDRQKVSLFLIAYNCYLVLKLPARTRSSLFMVDKS